MLARLEQVSLAVRRPALAATDAKLHRNRAYGVGGSPYRFENAE